MSSASTTVVYSVTVFLTTIVLPVSPVPLAHEVTRTNHTMEDEMLDEVMDSDIYIPRSFITERKVLWPVSSVNDRPVLYMPYVTYKMEPKVWRHVRSYMRQFRSKSCVQWVRRTNQTAYVNITGVLPNDWWYASPTTCRANLGYFPKIPMYMYLSDECLHVGQDDQKLSSIPHEMMHNLGFIHEQQRTDRDCYIYITGHYRYEYDNYGIFWDYTSDESFPYDTKSLMQYPSWADQLHSKFGEELGPEGDSLSKMDWMKLNYLYCGGPHVCDVDPDLCEKHRQIKEQCQY